MVKTNKNKAQSFELTDEEVELIKARRRRQELEQDVIVQALIEERVKPLLEEIESLKQKGRSTVSKSRKSGSLAEIIMKAFERHSGGPLHSEEIRETVRELGWEGAEGQSFQAYVCNTLAALVADGSIKKVKHGVYIAN